MSEAPIRTVGRYELLEVIGRGGAAVVYLAVQSDLHRRVALKELASSPAATGASFAARFAEESRLAGSLSHPNIVTVYEYFEHDGVPYIAMEYLSQGSLRPYVSALTLPQIVGVLEGVLAGLALGQSRSIVHRDLKPENLLVAADGRVKIADFGVARAYSDAVTREVVTAVGTTIGTPAYMAPEQALGGEVGPATDLYSLGIVAWELLVGRVPFADTETPVAVLYRQVHETVPPVRSVAPEVDPRIEGWLSRMLAKDPADRFASAVVAWDELEHVAVALLGPLWRRDARLPVVEPEAAGRPLAPAVFTDGAAQANPEAALDGGAASAVETAAPGPTGVETAAPGPAGAETAAPEPAGRTLDDLPVGADRPRRAIGRAVGIIAALGAITAAAIVGLSGSGAGKGARTSTNLGAKTSTTLAASTATKLAPWTVKRGEDPGYVTTGTTGYTTAQQFEAPNRAAGLSAKQEAARIAALQRDGFRGAVVETVQAGPGTGPGTITAFANNDSVSMAIELASPAAAHREAVISSSVKGRGVTRKQLTVPGVPGAKGFLFTFPFPSQREAAVGFAEGSCALRIKNVAIRGDVIGSVRHAVRAIWRRTHGHCP